MFTILCDLDVAMVFSGTFIMCPSTLWPLYYVAPLLSDHPILWLLSKLCPPNADQNCTWCGNNFKPWSSMDGPVVGSVIVHPTFGPHLNNDGAIASLDY